VKRRCEIAGLKAIEREGLFKRKYFCIATCYSIGFQCCLSQRSSRRVTKRNNLCMLYKIISVKILKVSARTLWNLRSLCKGKMLKICIAKNEIKGYIR